ncbi:patatin-like phospholipase family protein [Neptunicella sp. SCSIO 80796]|uniref:patatin-like phospholipase family protein n=1 Tax=Neptunicella plasticusilytica TaxID=3117012 RepID=UPI003A4D3E5B
MDATSSQLKLVPIFSGGGTRLPAHIGILDALNELHIKFDHVVGVSGGSIITALYCAGLSLAEIKILALDTDFRQFKGYSLLSLLRNGGLCSGDKFEQWMDEKLGGVRFRDLDIHLHILATDVNGGGPVVFDKYNSPDLKVSRAVRFSMSIPLVFSFKPYKNHLLVDGAILAEDALYEDWAGDGTPVICFRLKSEQEVQNIKPTSWFPLVSYIEMLIRTFMTAISREYVHEGHWHNTVVINTGNASPVDFAMTDSQKELLYQAGYLTALSYIPKKMVVPFNH